MLNFASRILKLRVEKGVTQEDLANFVGITKASVSKWENEISMPDISLLPKIATYFGVSIDELLGYKSDLSGEQIRKICRELVERIDEDTFDEVMEESQELVKEYYACYPFLTQICIVWLNHTQLADSAEKEMQIYQNICEVCDHVIQQCDDNVVSLDASCIKAAVELEMGKPEKAAEVIKELSNPSHMFNQCDGLLLQSYIMMEDIKNAEQFAQINMYQHLKAILGCGIQYISMHMKDLELCRETIKRIDALIEGYHMEKMNEVAVAVYESKAIEVMCLSGRKEEALEYLNRFANVVLLISSGKKCYGDSFFSRIEDWYCKEDTGVEISYSRKMVLEYAYASLDRESFQLIKDTKEFKHIKRNLFEVMKEK